MSTKRTRKREFLEEMNRVVPWADLVMLIGPYAPEGKRGRSPFERVPGSGRRLARSTRMLFGAVSFAPGRLVGVVAHSVPC